MKSIHRSVILSLALACAAVFCSAAAWLRDGFVTRCRSAKEFALRPFVDPAMRIQPAASDAVATRPAVELQRASAFVLRTIKRERPEIHPTWRMCPSI